MVWTLMLIAIAILFAAGFLWPGLWFFAIGVFVVWLAGMVIWGVYGRDGGDDGGMALESQRPRHRVE